MVATIHGIEKISAYHLSCESQLFNPSAVKRQGSFCPMRSVARFRGWMFCEEYGMRSEKRKKV
jgi:hypothetical protein